ncbi:MAG: flavin reductase family protein [Chloroflexi bacterium]|nr:flavin reductase family protein [Chloroflexota bacterium]MCL5075919.1 flavin reductase family protein [Chloroflexota bacterium]
MKEEIPLTRACRLLNPGPALLVTAAYKGRINVTTICWSTPVSFRPLLVAIALSPASLTHELISKSQEFVLNIAGAEIARQVHHCGSVSGYDVDKFAVTGLKQANPKVVSAPLIEECLGHLECGLIEAMTLGDHTLFVGEVLVAWVEKGTFAEVWLLQEKETKPLHYLGARSYSVLESAFEVEPPEVAP